MVMTLLRHQIKSDRSGLISWAVLTGLTAWFMVYMFDVMVNSGTLKYLTEIVESMPPAWRAVWGGGAGVLSLSGWAKNFIYGLLGPLVFSIYLGVYVAGLVTREADQHNLEFLLSLPVGRAQVILTKWLGLVTGLASLQAVLAIAVALTAGRDALASMPGFLWANVNMFLVFATVGSLLLLVSLFIDDYPRGTAVSLGLALAMFFLNFVLRDSPGAAIRRLLPQYYFDAMEVMSGTAIPWGNLAVLAGASAVFLAGSIYVFSRKQIAS